LTYAQIAERTGLSVKAVEKQMSKAIARLDRMQDRS
jgi:DNA-directed RNA polymerase specialized sigma24 family protein